MHTIEYHAAGAEAGGPGACASVSRAVGGSSRLGGESRHLSFFSSSLVLNKKHDRAWVKTSTSTKVRGQQPANRDGCLSDEKPRVRGAVGRRPSTGPDPLDRRLTSPWQTHDELCPLSTRLQESTPCPTEANCLALALALSLSSALALAAQPQFSLRLPVAWNPPRLFPLPLCIALPVPLLSRLLLQRAFGCRRARASERQPLFLLTSFPPHPPLP